MFILVDIQTTLTMQKPIIVIINIVGNQIVILTIVLFLSFSCKSSRLDNFYEKALNEANINQKLIILDFTAEWCGGCKAYDKYIFQDSSITQKLNEKFILLKINRDNPENFFLNNKFRITGLPHIVVINNDEKLLGSIEGFDNRYVNNPVLFLSNISNIVNSQEEINICESEFASDTTDIETITKLLELYENVNQYIGIQRLTYLLVKLRPTPDRLFEYNFKQAIIKLQKENNPIPIQTFIFEHPDLDYSHKWQAYSRLLYFYRDFDDVVNQDKYYLKLIKIDPDYFKHHYAEFLFENKLKLDTAILLTKEVNSIKDFRDDHWGHYLLAHSLASSGKVDEAVRQYSNWMDSKKQIWLSGEDYWILYFYARFANFYNVDLNRALNYIQIAEKNRNMIDEKILEAEILFNLGQLEKSIEKLEESLDLTTNPIEYQKISRKIKDYKAKEQSGI